MRQINGVFTQTSNRRHRRVGHLFRGRHKAILVDSDAYLLELSRYIVLNPVRARLVKTPLPLLSPQPEADRISFLVIGL